MLRSRFVVLPVTAAAAVTVALAGCSSSSSGSGSPASRAASAGSSAASSSAANKPADAETFVNDSLDAFVKAESAHVKGSFADAGDNGEELDIDISYGKDVAIGTLTVSGQQIEISKVADGSTYFKAAADFWRTNGAPEDAVATLADKYVVVTAQTDGFSEFASLLDRQAFVDGVKPSSSDLDGAEVTGPKDVNGISCYGIEDTDGQGAYYAAAEGDPLPVQLSSKGDGALDFDGYGETVDVPTPSPADVVQLPAS